MKKRVGNIKDIEQLFMDGYPEEEEKNLNIDNTNKEIKKLKKELENYRNKNIELEEKVEAMTYKKMEKINKKDNEEIAKIFLGFNSDEFCDNESRKLINHLKEKNKNLEIENKKYKKIDEMNQSKMKEKSFKKVSYKEIVDDFKKKYSFLSENSLIAISTAEYLYKNETNGRIDYTGSYINYVKALEIELKRVYKIKYEKVNFGGLIKKLSKNSTFKSFVDKIEHDRVLATRNKAVHERAISKDECGKIRKLLISDNWLNRISFLVEESLKTKGNKEVLFEGVILKSEGFLHIDELRYNKYSTDQNIDVLSKKKNLNGKIKEIGMTKIYNEEEFILI